MTCLLPHAFAIVGASDDVFTVAAIQPNAIQTVLDVQQQSVLPLLKLNHSVERNAKPMGEALPETYGTRDSQKDPSPRRHDALASRRFGGVSIDACNPAKDMANG